jgi:transposase
LGGAKTGHFGSGRNARPECRIHLIQLPPYCPHLNPIERLWAVMHQHVTHNRHYPTRKQFADAILAFFRETIPREWMRIPTHPIRCSDDI